MSLYHPEYCQAKDCQKLAVWYVLGLFPARPNYKQPLCGLHAANFMVTHRVLISDF